MSENVNHDRVDELFAQAAELPTKERTAFLSSACNGDAALLAELERLLSAHDNAERSHHFLSPLHVNALGKPKSESGSGRLEVRCPSCHTPIEVAVDTQLTDLTCSSCGSHFSLVDQSKATRMAPSLSTLGRFELIERLGVGGFGSVWKARDKELDRTVAIKIPREGAMTTEDQEKFFREARAAAQLRHPSIVSVHEVGRDGDSVYIVSDFVRGVTLGDWLTGQQLTSREAAELCAKIADALNHAHEQGVVHRDLKPANIMIDGDGKPHIMDFGLARRETGEITVTVDGHVLGTPAYMSPEQADGKGHQADRRSDIYSLGVILFQLLAGELPFRGNARMLMHQVIHDDPPSPRKLNGNISKDLETITLKCLEKDPQRRYQSAHLLALDMRRFYTGEPIEARPIGKAARGWRWIKRHKAVSILSSSLVVSLLLGTGISIYFAIAADATRRRAEKGFELLSQTQVLTEQLKRSNAKLESETTSRKTPTLTAALEAARAKAKADSTHVDDFPVDWEQPEIVGLSGIDLPVAFSKGAILGEKPIEIEIGDPPQFQLVLTLLDAEENASRKLSTRLYHYSGGDPKEKAKFSGAEYNNAITMLAKNLDKSVSEYRASLISGPSLHTSIQNVEEEIAGLQPATPIDAKQQGELRKALLMLNMEEARLGDKRRRYGRSLPRIYSALAERMAVVRIARQIAEKGQLELHLRGIPNPRRTMNVELGKDLWNVEIPVFNDVHGNWIDFDEEAVYEIDSGGHFKVTPASESQVSIVGNWRKDGGKIILTADNGISREYDLHEGIVLRSTSNTNSLFRAY